MIALERARWIYRAWRYRVYVEPSEVQCVLNYLRPGDTAVDIGAHKGAYTFWMRSRVGARGSVIAFEPQAVLAWRLRRLVRTRRYQNVLVEEMGLSSSTGRRSFYAPEAPSPGATFERPWSDAIERQVQAASLDDYLSGSSPARIRLIKCDVEGHELEVLKGARELLSRDHPALLLECEVRHRSSGRVDEVFSYLRALGYDGVGLRRAGGLSLESFDPDIHQRSPSQRDYVNNFFFTPGEAGG